MFSRKLFLYPCTIVIVVMVLLVSCKSKPRATEFKPDLHYYYLINSALEEMDVRERFLGVKQDTASGIYSVAWITVSEISIDDPSSHWDIRVIQGNDKFYIFSKIANKYLAADGDSLLLTEANDRYVWRVKDENDQLEIFRTKFPFTNHFLGTISGSITLSNDVSAKDRKWKYQIATDKELPDTKTTN